MAHKNPVGPRIGVEAFVENEGSVNQLAAAFKTFSAPGFKHMAMTTIYWAKGECRRDTGFKEHDGLDIIYYIEPQLIPSPEWVSLSSPTSHNLLDIPRMLERQGVLKDYVHSLDLGSLAFKTWPLTKYGQLVWANSPYVHRWIVQFSLYTPWGVLERGPFGLKDSTALVNFYFDRGIDERHSFWIVTSDRSMGLFSNPDWTTVLKPCSYYGDSPRNFRGLSPDMEIALFACDLGSNAWREVLRRLASEVKKVGDVIDRNESLFDPEQMHNQVYPIEKILAQVSRALGENQFTIRSLQSLVMDTQLFPDHPSFAKDTGFSIAEDYGTSDNVVSRKILLCEFQKAVTFLEASISSVESLTKELTHTRDFIIRSASLNRGKRMEWVTTESLKVSFVMQSFTQVLGFAVLLLLPPIFISTFLGSSLFLFDVQLEEPGSVPSWQISHQGLTLWLSLALPITAVFLVILYFIYWRSSGIRNPVFKYMAAVRDLLRLPFGRDRVTKVAMSAPI